MESVVLYVTEIWNQSAKPKAKLPAIEINLFSRVASVKQYWAEEEIVNWKDTVDITHGKQLVWFVHVKRLNNDRLSEKVHKMEPNVAYTQGDQRRRHHFEGWN